MDVKKIDHWVFDLDNTLYPSRYAFFDQISARITHYVQRHLGCDRDQAKVIQRTYFTEYGTTLNGLMRNDNVDPQDYLHYVHDIDLSILDDAPRLAPLIDSLPGKKYIFTNGDAPYAQRVIERLGLDGLFDSICDICACDYRPKPEMIAYQTLLNKTDIDPLRAVFFEDMARNLETAKSLGMATVWIDGGSDWGRPDVDDQHKSKDDFIDVTIDCIETFLTEIVNKIGN